MTSATSITFMAWRHMVVFPILPSFWGLVSCLWGRVQGQLDINHPSTKANSVGAPMITARGVDYIPLSTRMWSNYDNTSSKHRMGTHISTFLVSGFHAVSSLLPTLPSLIYSFTLYMMHFLSLGEKLSYQSHAYLCHNDMSHREPTVFQA